MLGPNLAASDADADPAWLEPALGGFLLLGAALRIVPYAWNFPLWGDESFLAVNLLGRGYRDLLGPLDYGQVCPPLFLWIARAVVDVLGFSERSLRLVPLACGLASLVLFWRVAAQVLKGAPLLLAVAVFSVSIHPIRHSSDFKPYASDLLMALLLLLPALGWLRRPERAGRLWWLAGLAPVTLLVSYPAAFVAGGIALGLAVPAWRSGRPGVRAAFAAFVMGVIATAILLHALVARAQAAAVMTWMNAYWARSFPPTGGPWPFLRWLVLSTTGSMLSYPDGGRDGGSVATFALVVVGSVVLVRGRRAAVVATLLAPLPLTLAAAILRRYPYGGEARTMQFLAPGVCLLMGLGLATILRLIPAPGGRLRALKVGAVALAVLGVVLVGKMLLHPYRLTYDLRAREFARSFWPSQARDAEVACIRWDFGVVEAIYRRGVLNPKTPIFLCNQMIYSPGRRDGGPRWDRVSEARPLRCVLFHETAVDQPELLGWLRSMAESYTLRRVERIDLDVADPGKRPSIEPIHIYEFTPRVGPDGRALTARRPSGLLRR